jgi:hypothetical protein
VSPKLYAEIDPSGAESLKGKGLLRSYRETMSFAAYEEIFAKLASGVSVYQLYSHVPVRQKFVMAILADRNTEEPRYESKSVRADTWQKRKIDWQTGKTKPWTLRELASVISKWHNADDY